MKRGYKNVYSVCILFSMPSSRKEVNQMADFFVYVITYQNLSGTMMTYMDAFRLRKDAETVAKQLRACEYKYVEVRKMRLL